MTISKRARLFPLRISTTSPSTGEVINTPEKSLYSARGEPAVTWSSGVTFTPKGRGAKGLKSTET
ncbi:Uncharacterised protein [Chlamydia trachomatis]|nr:Uncharacterised protein [Chlamydia trachomatis]